MHIWDGHASCMSAVVLRFSMFLQVGSRRPCTFYKITTKTNFHQLVLIFQRCETINIFKFWLKTIYIFVVYKESAVYFSRQASIRTVFTESLWARSWNYPWRYSGIGVAFPGLRSNMAIHAVHLQCDIKPATVIRGGCLESLLSWTRLEVLIF